MPPSSSLRSISGLRFLGLLSLLFTAPAWAEPTPVTLSLTEQFPVAQHSGPVTSLAFAETRGWRHYTAGWNRLRHQADGAGHCWTSRGIATFELPVVQPRDMQLILPIAGLDPATYGALPPQTVEILWNRQSLGVVDLGPKTRKFTFSVLSVMQRTGPNRLELSPNFWIEPRLMGKRKDSANFGVLSRGVSIEPVGLPGPTGDAAVVDAEAVVQQMNSVMTYYLWIPEEAALRATIVLEAPVSWSGAGAVQARVTLMGDSGEEHEAFTTSLPSATAGSPISLDVSLASFQGQALAVTFAVVYEPAPDAAVVSAELPSIRWNNLRMEGLQREAPASSPVLPKPRNIFVILFDALRADRTSPYGNKDIATPNIQQLSEHGVTFLNAFSNSHWTRTSVASLMTGLYPDVHGCLTSSHRLSSRVPVLAELLHNAGFFTAGVVNNGNVGTDCGFARGFDHFIELFDESPTDKKRAYAEARLKGPEALADHVWLTHMEPIIQKAAGASVFTYLHEIDPHDPYAPPPPFNSLYGRPDSLLNFAVNGGTVARGATGAVTGLIGGLVNNGDVLLSATERAYLEGQYAGEISYMDRYLGRMLAHLQEDQLLDETLVVFLSDHGEEFLEHGGLSHGQSVYDELLRVPLILALPGVFDGGARIAADVQMIDIAPTLLELVGVAVPEVCQGQSLLRLLEGNHDARPLRATFAKRYYDDRHAYTDSVRYGAWKLHAWTNNKEGGRSYLELFNVATDPAEKHDVWRDHPVIGQTLYQMLRWHLHQCKPLEPPASEEAQGPVMDQETRQNLEALGYLQ